MLKQSIIAAFITALLVACSNSVTPTMYLRNVQPGPAPRTFSAHVIVHSGVGDMNVLSGAGTVAIGEVVDGTCTLDDHHGKALGCQIVANTSASVESSTLGLFTGYNGRGCEAGIGHYHGYIYEGEAIRATYRWTGKCK